MASLLSSSGIKNGTQLGNASTSSLIKSSQSLQTQLNTYHDTVQRLTFENNPSDGNLQDYLDYLQKRTDVLGATGSITDATKALEMQQTMRSAISKNTSFNIQWQSIQILSGSGSDQQKLDYIGDAFQRAMSVGDTTLAQSLEAQGYSLSQKMQYDAQAAVQSAKTLSDANDTAIKAGFNDVLDQVKGAITDVYTKLKVNGDGVLAPALKDFTKSIGEAYKQVTGSDLPKNAGVSLGATTQAYFNMEAAYNVQAAHALQADDPAAAAKYAQFDGDGNLVGGAAHDILTGKATIDVPGIGGLDLQQANQWALSDASGHSLYRVVTGADGTNSLKMNAVVGYQMVNGQAVPISDGNAGTAFGNLTANKQLDGKAVQSKLKDLGLTFTGGSDNLSVQLTNDAIKKLHLEKSGLKSGDQVSLIPQATGQMQFTKDGKIFTLALDSKNLIGVSRTGTDGKSNFIGGQYGFNQKLNTMISNATVQQLQAKAQQQIADAAAAKNTQNSSFSMGNAVTNIAHAFNLFSAPKPSASMAQRAGGGYNFTSNGHAISAARYAQLTGTPFRSLLQQMATSGDSGAATALGFVGNDYKYDPTKITSYQNASTYNALTWGAGVPSDSGQAPANILSGMANGNVKF
jgi:molybdopterin converting factor small subunit